MDEPETPAQSNVLATTELLELIFLCLDARTLFAIQRVCRNWNSLINDSRKLQELMFLRVPPNAKQPPSLHHCATNWEERLATAQFMDDVILCPVLELATQFVRTHPGHVAASCTQSALRGSPSWHRMLLSNPPCKQATVALWWRIGDSMRGSIYLESVTSSAGLRFKDVVQAALAQRAGNWKEMPDGKLLPLSAAGQVTLDEFLKQNAGEDVRMMDSTSVFFLRMV